ncbi:Substrate-binding region of ABC-type glycine betaine transport system [Isosphaera pallida ATCC 43644]|uniref:Substrate-binding region of ABC-type glycine betaine transport system n=1 Tax=Isosphaera pallida (strain ATCC 43644 / DSM 9630 / IS1B) TaxID=575540 RepID=E8R603_ISOPI|nr:glycine betaine ABC transporter substrate-binding protein [Isosphaera pallida]ADV63905.1 Substrate-binding region of ABC-type glycine betaine transport system [Isosphaera pallida ATCC 43644]
MPTPWWEFLEQVGLALGRSAPNAADHLRLSLAALTLGGGLALPLAVASLNRPRLRAGLLGLASLVQTIPSLALLALAVPILAGLGVLIGRDLPTLGFLPALGALTLYGLLPVLRNTVTGLGGVDPQIVESARGLGMTDAAILRAVQLPLAAPVILAGARTATVQVVGAATLATPVGQRCLGDLIFRGLQLRDPALVVAGCLAAAALALILDAVLGGIERAAASRRPSSTRLALIALATLTLLGLAAPDLLRAAQATSAEPDPAADRPVLTIGAKNFTEQYILARVIEDTLEQAGTRVERAEGLGSTVLFDGLASGAIDVAVDYSGTLWVNILKRDDRPGRREVIDILARELPTRYGVTVIGPLGFENAYALAMRRQQAQRLGVASIADLTRHAPDLIFGSDYEFLGRPEWQAVRDHYHLRFKDRRTFEPTFLYDAARRGEADVISAFTTDGRIDAFDLVTLEDPRQAIPPYDALLLVSRRVANRPEWVEALRRLVNTIPVEAMRRANAQVDRAGSQTAQAIASAARDLRPHATPPPPASSNPPPGPGVSH